MPCPLSRTDLRNFYTQGTGQVSKVGLASSWTGDDTKMAKIWIQENVEKYQYGGMFAFLAILGFCRKRDVL